MPRPIHKKCLQAILILDFLGWNQTEIATAVNIHRHTVRTSLSTHRIYTLTNLEPKDDSNLNNSISQFLQSGMNLKNIQALLKSYPPHINSLQELTRFVFENNLLKKEVAANDHHTKNCLHCGKKFIPDPRQKNQQFCALNPCQKSSKKRSQQKWTRSLGKNYWKHNC